MSVNTANQAERSYIPCVPVKSGRESACSHSHECTCRVVGLPTFTETSLHSHRVDCREVFLTPLQVTDPGEIVTMVTASGRSYARQINTEDTAVQEANTDTPAQLVLGN